MLKFLNSLPINQKRIVVFLYDATMGFFSFALALCIRFSSFDYNNFPILSFWDIVLISFFTKLIAFHFFRLSRGIWRFSSTPDLILILKANSTAVLSALLIIFLWNRLEQVPRSAFIIDWILCSFLLGGGRFAYRLWKEERATPKDRLKTLVIGAGHAGEQLIREINKDPTTAIEVVGIVDDKTSRHGRTIHGVEVLGAVKNLKDIVVDTEARNAFVAIPSASAPQIRRIVEECLELNLQVKTLPAVKELVDGKVTVSHLRPVNVEDLLSRDPVELDREQLGEMLTNQVVMVTGAGGSIGSELCNQILKFKPKKLVLFEICEYFIYNTELNLSGKYPEIEIVPCVGDVRDRNRIKEVLLHHRPSIVFHAAAYKHVPMMEANPREAVKTNVMGTKTLAEEVAEAGVKRFVMISTDKAVNPTNIMGATKRIAEMICQYYQTKSKTEFITVRFGNVLGSAGSVIPLFMNQIKNGGPVTVTHPEITRYFMSIPEATQLVLQAGSQGSAGEILVLEMGQPVKILDLATDLIKLSGLRPGEDIEIKFTGLRPGEKLYEELLADSENTVATKHKMVRVAKAREVQPDIMEKVSSLLSDVSEDNAVKQSINFLVPEYRPQEVIQ